MKKQLTFLVLLALLGALVFLLEGCGDEPQKPNTCKDLSPISAKFTITESFQGGYPNGWKVYDSDTIGSQYVTFTALEEGAKYEWTLGSETITKKSFSRYGLPIGQNVTVSLKVTKEPNKACFPTDDGVDYLERKFYVNNNCIKTPLDGQFEGSHVDEPGTKFTINIDFCYLPQGYNRDFIRIINLSPSCEGISDYDEYGYKQAYFYMGACLFPSGIMRVSGSKNDSIRLEYTRNRNTNGDRETKIFIGIRKRN